MSSPPTGSSPHQAPGVGRGLIITGVGRSGTSIACKLATLTGLRPPPVEDLPPANFANPDGYWESLELVCVNDAILARIGASYAHPPQRLTQRMVARLEQNRAGALESFHKVFGLEGGWVWKDPRLMVTLPFWDTVITDHPVLFIARDPRFVARSTFRQGNQPLTETLAIWERQIRLALRALQGKMVLATTYERLTADPDAWIKQLVDFCRRAELPVSLPTDSVRDQVHKSKASGDLPELSSNQQNIFESLVAIQGSHDVFPNVPIEPESEEVEATIRTTVTPNWADPELARRNVNAERSALITERDNYRAALREAQGQISDAERVIAAQQDQIADAMAVISAQQQRLTEVSGEVERLRAELGTLGTPTPPA
jgi:hypothetical protein